MQLFRKELLGKGPCSEVRERPLYLGEPFRVRGDGEEGVDCRLALPTVSPVDLILAIGAAAVVFVPSSGLGIKRAIVALLAEEEEAGDLPLFLFGEWRGARDVVCLVIGERVSFTLAGRVTRGESSRGKVLLA